MTLFREGEFTSHSGLFLPWKVDCDAFTDEDWEWCAKRIFTACFYSEVEGVPTGGLKLAETLRPFAWRPEEWGHQLLIVDDVLTTGKSMEEQRAGRDAIGFVVFARGPCPSWVRALWTYTGEDVAT